MLTAVAARPLAAVAPAATASRRGPKRLQAAQPAAPETAEEGSKPLRVSMVRYVRALWQGRRRRRRPASRSSAA